MKIWNFLKGIFKNANRAGNNADVKRGDDCSRVHSYASRRERALSDISRVRMLVEEEKHKSSRVANSSPCHSLRELIPTFGELVSKRTGESSVYWNARENAYYKVKSPAAKAPLKRTVERDWIYEHIIHNILFPETAYELIAIVKDLGEIKIVLKQKCVSSEQLPTDKEVSDFLFNEHGLIQEDRYWFGNALFAIADVGSKGDNVLKGDNGKLYFIDPLIRLKRPALDVIERLIGK